MNSNSAIQLASYVEALRPILYIEHFDSSVVDELIRNVAGDAKIKEYNNALGMVNFVTKSPMQDYDLVTFLRNSVDDGYDHQAFLVLRDIHDSLKDPCVIALLKTIAERMLHRESYHCTVFIVSPLLVIPRELENYITVFDTALPTMEEIIEVIRGFASDLQTEIAEDTIGELALSLKGLNEFQIKQILNLAYQNGGSIDADDKKLILKEKEQLIKKSGMLEIVNFQEDFDDIGGLENLKEWLSQKAVIFKNLDKALRFGVDRPKGIMIVGMPGCGKSLTAKATAKKFDIPLVRLDVGRLLGKYVGESEENMRKALQMAEAISPCVLWVDEIEKAFSGVGGDGGGSDVTTRLFGQFLTWLQEKENTVFIVATANDISKLPPEFLRKGRFDEIFYVDLPNRIERRRILEIHLKKRRKLNKGINFPELVDCTEGFNGADLEAVVKETIEQVFIEGGTVVTTTNLRKAIEETKSISSILGDKMKRIEETVKKMDIKRASK